MSDFVGMNLDLKDFDRLLRQDDLIETPVDIQTFVQDKEYLGLPPLSDIQLEIVRHSTQILKLFVCWVKVLEKTIAQEYQWLIQYI
jgi:hypothetical protein